MTRQEELHDDGFDMIILGGGLAALAAGYAAVKRGQRPLILEERGRPGGLVCGATFAGAQVDIGAESYATRNLAVRELCHELGLETVAPNSSSWVWDHARCTAVAIPAGTFGIPSDIHDPVFVEGLRAVAGEAAVTRAWQDLELPPEAGRGPYGQSSLGRFCYAFRRGDSFRPPRSPDAGPRHPGFNGGL